MSNLHLRIISALVLIPVVITVIVMGGHAFRNFVYIAYLISLYEWVRLSLKTKHKILFTLFGFLYLSVCFLEFRFLRDGFPSGLYLVITMLCVVWAADTGAYFIGRRFGKNKLAPSISPGKTWEGMAGSVLASAVTLLALILLAPSLKNIIPNFIPVPNLSESILLLIIGGFFGYIGQMGDLLESFLKRKADAKDSSNLIPGHGGVLDRIDSILLVSPFFVLMALYVL